MNTKQVKVLVCRVGRRPVVEQLTMSGDSYLDDMQKIVGGNVEVIGLDDGRECWMNEDGIGLGLPLNRCIPAKGRGVPAWLDDAFVINATGAEIPKSGEDAEWRILGDFFIANHNHGELADIDDEGIAFYTKMFDSEDTAAAKRMNEQRTKMEQRAW